MLFRYTTLNLNDIAPASTAIIHSPDPVGVPCAAQVRALTPLGHDHPRTFSD